MAALVDLGWPLLSAQRDLAMDSVALASSASRKRRICADAFRYVNRVVHGRRQNSARRERNLDLHIEGFLPDPRNEFAVRSLFYLDPVVCRVADTLGHPGRGELDLRLCRRDMANQQRRYLRFLVDGLKGDIEVDGVLSNHDMRSIGP